MILVDVTHTSHCRANTGIQRVTRRIVRELGESAVPVVYDHYAGHWRGPDSLERKLTEYAAHLASHGKRSATWSWPQKLKGRMIFLGLRKSDLLPARVSAIIVPEVFAPPRTVAAYCELRQSTGAPIIGVFNDLIPLLMPGCTPVKIVEKFEAYLETLRGFDAIAAISEFSRDSLVEYWESRGLTHPPVTAIPLGVDIPDTLAPAPVVSPGRPPTILCVGTLEGRKNHFSLLKAAESLWSGGAAFELTLFGGANLETAGEAVAMIDRLIHEGRPLRWVRGGSDDAMEAEYARSDFTVYPSLMEGFGLPVLESLARGRPCICSGENAMAETARDGGCLLVGYPSPEALSSGMRRLIEDRELLGRLGGEARGRSIRSWADYSQTLRVFAEGVKMRKFS